MRHLFLDTETTGLDPKLGHRIIEIAAVEFVNRRATGRNLHLYFDPDREVDPGAAEVHGMTWDDLRGKPKFHDVAPQILDFARDATWIIHNAPFDIGFLDAEFERAGLPLCAALHGGLIDTLSMAREAFPGKRNNLNALCERFGISNAHRTLHGALLDAQLLGEVYLAMTRGQESLTIDMGTGTARSTTAVPTLGHPSERPALLVIAPSSEELAAHFAYLDALDRESKGRCLWLQEALAA
jgi:DNA polymerase-3 subunit epsilon